MDGSITSADEEVSIDPLDSVGIDTESVWPIEERPLVENESAEAISCAFVIENAWTNKDNRTQVEDNRILQTNMEWLNDRIRDPISLHKARKSCDEKRKIASEFEKGGKTRLVHAIKKRHKSSLDCFLQRDILQSLFLLSRE